MPRKPLISQKRRGLNMLAALANLYLALLLGWGLLYLTIPDRWWWLFMVTSAAPWLFPPLAGILPLALALRRRIYWLRAGAGLLLGAVLLGGELLPRTHHVTAVSGLQLSLMSFNVYGGNPTPARVVTAIAASGADLVALQELSPEMGAAIAHDLAATYPYRLLNPQPGVFGMGLLSRYPLRPLATLPGENWFGTPQVVALDLDGQEVIVVNVHALPPLVSVNQSHTEGVRERERQAEAIVALAAERGEPLLALGDFNSNPHHRPYQIIRALLGDAWEAQGGLGFTWPAPDSSGLPLSLIRIDYIFHSAHWAPLSASLGVEGAGSDHLPLQATLALRRP